MKRILGVVLASGFLAWVLGARAAEEDLKGTWVLAGPADKGVELEFDGWDTLTVRLDGGEAVIADYAFEGESLFITDIEGPLACEANVATATYLIRLAGDRLELAASGDECTARAERLDGQVFSRLE